MLEIRVESRLQSITWQYHSYQQIHYEPMTYHVHENNAKIDVDVFELEMSVMVGLQNLNAVLFL